MKKYITLAALLAVGAAFASASDFTSSITTGNAGNGSYYGGTLKLTDTFVSTTYADPSVTKLPLVLELDSITFYSRTSGSQGESTAYLALYKYEGDEKTGTFVALSTNSVKANGLNAALTFNFSDDVRISSDQQYQMLFVNTSSTAENVATFSGYQEHGIGVGLSVLQQSSLPQGDGTYKGTGINSWEGKYIPKVTIMTTIPEPSAFGLLAGLGALALVGTRRRRK